MIRLGKIINDVFCMVSLFAVIGFWAYCSYRAITDDSNPDLCPACEQYKNHIKLCPFEQK